MPYHTEHSAGDLLGPGSLERTRSPLFAPVAAGAGTSIGERYNRLLEQTNMRQRALASLASARQSEISLEKGGRELEALRAESDVLDELDAIPYWDKDLANKLAPFQELATYNPQIERALNSKAGRANSYHGNMGKFIKAAVDAGIKDDANGNNLTDSIRDASKLLKRNKIVPFMRKVALNEQLAEARLRDIEQTVFEDKERAKAEMGRNADLLKEFKGFKKSIIEDKYNFGRHLVNNKAFGPYWDGLHTEAFKVEQYRFVPFEAEVEGDKPEGDKPEGDKPEGDKPKGEAEGPMTRTTEDKLLNRGLKKVKVSPLEAMAVDEVRHKLRSFISDDLNTKGELTNKLTRGMNAADKKAFKDSFKKGTKIPSNKVVDLTELSLPEAIVTRDDVEAWADYLSAQWSEQIAFAALESNNKEQFLAQFVESNPTIFLEQLNAALENVDGGAKKQLIEYLTEKLSGFVAGGEGGRSSNFVSGIYDAIDALRKKNARHITYNQNPIWKEEHVLNLRKRHNIRPTPPPPPISQTGSPSIGEMQTRGGQEGLADMLERAKAAAAKAAAAKAAAAQEPQVNK